MNCIELLSTLCRWNQGCSLGLDVSVSRRSRDLFLKCLSLVNFVGTFYLGLVLDKKSNVSVSEMKVSLYSEHYAKFCLTVFASFLQSVYKPNHSLKIFVIHHFALVVQF